VGKLPVIHTSLPSSYQYQVLTSALLQKRDYIDLHICTSPRGNGPVSQVQETPFTFAITTSDFVIIITQDNRRPNEANGELWSFVN
jgi:hypothetical protein